MHQDPVALSLAGIVTLLILVWCSTRLRARGATAALVAASSTDRPLVRREFETEMLNVGDLRWRIHRAGAGPPLLLLHGLGANLYCWRSLVDAMDERYRVIVPDLPGFGRSSIADEDHYGLDDQVPRLIALLDHLGIDRCYVAGNSMGGNIALWLALRHPDRVRALAVIAPAASPRLIPPGLTLLHWTAYPLALIASRAAITWMYDRTVSRRNVFDAERIEDAFKTYSGQHRAIRSLMRATQAIRDPRLPRALSAVTSPVLILWGSRDRLVSRLVIDGLEKSLPRARSFVHLGGGHHLQEDEPAWTSEKLTQFFAEFHD